MNHQEDPNHLDSPSVSALPTDVLLRLMGFSLVTTVISLILGIAIWLIVHGLFILLLRLSMYWGPAFRLSKNLLGVDLFRTNSGPIPIRWWRIPILILWAGAGFLFIIVGTRMLVEGGFLDQNIIYWILRDK